MDSRDSTYGVSGIGAEEIRRLSDSDPPFFNIENKLLLQLIFLERGWKGFYKIQDNIIEGGEIAFKEVKA